MNLGIWSLLTLIFTVLKLCNVIAWSWWLVLLPSFIGVAITLVILFLAIVVALRS
jgi:hypothetical protein